MLDRAWRRGWADRPSLDPAALVRKAAARADAMPDADAIGWRRRLDRLAEDLEHTAQLTALGRTVAHGQLVSALAARFRAHALWRRHPSIAEQPLPAPVVVVGQMRSGTTRMQRMLACDPRLTFTRFFESWNPLPARSTPGWPDERKLKGWAALAAARWLNPHFHAIHPTAWHAPDEEIGLHNLLLFGSAFEAQWRVPGYTAAVEADEATAVYAEFRRLLQTLAWLRGDRGDRPLIMKVPQFSQDLPALLRAFPDARLVCVHRDRDAVIASSASLVCNQMSLQSDAVDPLWIGREWRRKVALRERRLAAARGEARAPAVDVDYAAMSRDWRREMARVYAMLRLPLTAAVVARMDRYARATDASRTPPHRYDPGHFGLGTPELALAA